jgi:hypothetical protein
VKGKPPRARIKPRARDEAPNPKRVANVTDPDSRLVHTRKGCMQGYNAQAVTTLEQVIVAAELTQDANDLQQLEPLLTATAATLGAGGIRDQARHGHRGRTTSTAPGTGFRGPRGHRRLTRPAIPQHAVKDG